MSGNETHQAAQLVRNIDAALAQNPALAEKQLEDIKHLRAELHRLCQAGNVEEVDKCEKLALKIIRQGAPVPE